MFQQCLGEGGSTTFSNIGNNAMKRVLERVAVRAIAFMSIKIGREQFVFERMAAGNKLSEIKR